MRKLIVGAMLSIDGVMQAPGGPTEDLSHGFAFGGWTAPLGDSDEMAGAEIWKQFEEPFDLLLGRRTYEIFAAYWPYHEGGPADEIAKPFNKAVKYVATRKGLDLSWKPAVALNDAAKDVARLKTQDGPNLLTQGSTELVHALFAAGLVDELRTFTFPVILGKGKRLFDAGSQPRTFALTHSVVSRNGIIAARYTRAGEVKTGTVGGEQTPSAAELKRREKLQAEG